MTVTGKHAAARRPLPLALGLALLLASGCAVFQPPPPVPQGLVPERLSPQAFANEKVYLEAWGIVRSSYFDKKVLEQPWVDARNQHLPEAIAAKDSRALYGAINAMLAELHDSHTAAMTPEDAEAERTKRKARCGFQLLKLEDTWVVHDVMPGSPADQAGVQRGWVFVSEDGVAVGKRPLFDRKDGQVVHDVFLDSANRRAERTMTAKVLPTYVKPQARTLEGGIVYLRFDDFEVETRRWFSSQLKAHRDAPAVIIDLRSNPGGGLFSLDITLGELFDHSVGMGTFVHRSGWKQDEDAKEIFSAHYSGKVAVLTSPLSASSSEIFSNALKVQHRAILVGEKTAGAVRGSLNYALPDGGAVQVSVMNYLTPDNKELEGAGVIPDIEVKTTLADLRAGRDPDLQAALLRLRPEPADRRN